MSMTLPEVEDLDDLDFPTPCGVGVFGDVPACEQAAVIVWCCGACDFTSPVCAEHQGAIETDVIAMLARGGALVCNACHQDITRTYHWAPLS